MSAANRNRTAVLQALLRLDMPSSELAAMLADVGWDTDRPLVELSRRGMHRVLQAAVAGSVPATSVESWADLIEGREDIGREPGSEELLNEALFELANPALAGASIQGLIQKWMRRLE